MIRLIASDIDGTLLRAGATNITPVLFDQIHRLRERGVLFCPASGRQYPCCRHGADRYSHKRRTLHKPYNQ